MKQTPNGTERKKMGVYEGVFTGFWFKATYGVARGLTSYFFLAK